MALPVFAPFPPPTVQESFPAEEWSQCLDAWTILANVYLQADDKTFKSAAENPSFPLFLSSYYEQWRQSNQKNHKSMSQNAEALKQCCFRLVERYSRLHKQHDLFSALDFLSRFARAHVKHSELRSLLTVVWQTGTSTFQKSLQRWKTSVVQDSESGSTVQVQPSLSTITPLLYSCIEAAVFIITGSDFLEAALSAYIKDDRVAARKTWSLIAYTGLVSLVRAEHANTAALSDHLYSLKAHADSNTHAPTLLADIVTNSPLLKIVQQHADSIGEVRLTKLIEQLRTYKMPSISRKRKHTASKGKHRMPQSHDDMHVHRMSLVSQIQDLFPDLGAGFILRLLDEYEDDTEQVIAHLLEDSLPPHLQQLDRNEQAPISNTRQQEMIDELAPRSTPPIPDTFIPHRANIFDNDDFDRLEIDTTKLHIGKKPDNIGSAPTSSKAAILAALAAFDSDDDERDDTYDIEDVGGTVDAAHHDGDDSAIALAINDTDMLLYNTYQRAPEAFARSAETRRSTGRAELKQQTSMTDEAIEGWAIMLQRDPKRARRIGFEASRFDGQQNDIARTAYREVQGDTETEDSDAGGSRGGMRGRGRGRGAPRGRGRGRGSSVAGPSDDAATANAQRRKEANKSSRANHNRRDQRARKMARGGFPGAS